MQLNSKNLEFYKEIEKSLWRFFRLFGNLCELCFKETEKQVKERKGRSNRQYWCCCMIDNQVHDNWAPLDAVQQRTGGRSWYSKIKEEVGCFQDEAIGRKMPGNGPCPALGEAGCAIRRFRPITCTTQLCEKMLFVLSRLSIANVAFDKALQIEDIINLPDILETLYGLGSGQRVDRQQAREYITAVNKIRTRFARVDQAEKRKLIEEAIHFFLVEGGG